MNLDNMGALSATISAGFFAGVLFGYALKKVVRVAAVVVGLFFAGIAYLQYQQILSINWTKLQVIFQNTVSILENAKTRLPGFSNSDHATELSNLGIPLTGSMSMGFVVGFMKG